MVPLTLWRLFSGMAVATLPFSVTCPTLVPVVTRGTAMVEGEGGVEVGGTGEDEETGDDGGLKT